MITEAERVRATREALALTQSELAKQLGKTERQIRRYEKGTAPVPKLVTEWLMQRAHKIRHLPIWK